MIFNWLSYSDIFWLCILLPISYKLIKYIVFNIWKEIRFDGVNVDSPWIHMILSITSFLFFCGLGILTIIFFDEPLHFVTRGRYIFIHNWVGGIATLMTSLFFGVFTILLSIQLFMYFYRKKK